MSKKFLLEETEAPEKDQEAQSKDKEAPKKTPGEVKRESYVQEYICKPDIEAEIYDSDQVLFTLDKALSVALKQKKKDKKRKAGIETGPYTSPNVLIVGPAGCGKTERIEDWARRHHVHLVEKDIKVFSRDTLASVSTVDLENGKALTVPTQEFDGLDNIPEEELNEGCIGSVLFLDEYNRAPDAVRNVLLTLIRNHKLDGVSGAHEYEQLLFVVVAQNPSVEDGGDLYGSTFNLDPAERNRFPFKVFVNPSKKVTLKYLTKCYQNEYDSAEDDQERADAKRKLVAAQCFMQAKKPEFDNPTEVRDHQLVGEDSFTPRSFTDMLENTDGDPDEIAGVKGRIGYWETQFGSDKLVSVTSVCKEIRRILAGDPEVNYGSSKSNELVKNQSASKYRDIADQEDAEDDAEELRSTMQNDFPPEEEAKLDQEDDNVNVSDFLV